MKKGGWGKTNPTRASQSQIHSEIHCLVSPKTLTYGVSDCDLTLTRPGLLSGDLLSIMETKHLAESSNNVEQVSIYTPSISFSSSSSSSTTTTAARQHQHKPPGGGGRDRETEREKKRQTDRQRETETGERGTDRQTERANTDSLCIREGIRVILARTRPGIGIGGRLAGFTA